MREGTLQGLALFEGFPESERRVLEAVFVEQRAPRGHIFIREGELARASTSAVYLVLEGEVIVTRSHKDGSLATTAFVRPGELFGIIGLATDMPRAATCMALGDVNVASLARPTFQHLRSQHTRLAARFELMLARQVVRDLRGLTGGIVDAFRRGHTAAFETIHGGDDD
ncbi:MAG: cyclic nucleotide-binding domain-containing protein [Myxococcales bacterium]|nr:cyclic nucleotide-binding domain-containing protein [Myxococcales bacterium]MCB9531095.1 cyclic nucleotide-binding domain-containing protein [Myxococcales bacterium]MCB9533005.1 cyclic nucleotide-binding domain-containing protein [Myxococcales bacterium]